jgi:hypothetical protein
MERFLLLEYRFGDQHDITLSPRGHGSAGFLGGRRFFSRRSPEMFFYVDAGFDDGNAFGFEELFLEGGVGFADKDFAVGAEDAVPRDALALRSGTHGAAGSACATA